MNPNSQELYKRFVQFRDDLPEMAANCLRIRTKSGALIPFTLNSTQARVHAILERQRAEKGWVRAIILKGRQEGISTYVAGRYYHRASLRKGVNVYILTHEQSATQTLFGMVDRFQRHNPMAPHTGAANAKELEFDKLESSYAVATAGAKAAGRSKAISLFHGSEVAYWPNAADHFGASVQGVPLAPNTEVLLESTSAGPSGEFYERYQMAEAGIGDYIAIFVPWYWCDDYTREPDPGFELSDAEGDEGQMSEIEYAATYGLSMGQMAWRRAKIAELRDPTVFQREYPASPAEAWIDSKITPFIDAALVLRARKRVVDEPQGPLIIGVDPAANGGDRFSICARKGMKALWIKSRTKVDPLVGIQWVSSIIDELRPQRVCVDTGYIGAAIVSGLKSMKPEYLKIVRGVDFGATSQHKLAKPKMPGPANRRAEMWSRMKEWLQMEEGACLPDDDTLQSDICAPRLKPKLNNDFLLESKQDMKARKIRSPDSADALALTFAFNEILPYSVTNKPADPMVTGTPAVPYRPGMAPGPHSWMG